MERIQATDYHRISRVADPQLSPDGETVAFVHEQPDDAESYETNIWTVPAESSESADPFTTGGQRHRATVRARRRAARVRPQRGRRPAAAVHRPHRRRRGQTDHRRRRRGRLHRLVARRRPDRVHPAQHRGGTGPRVVDRLVYRARRLGERGTDRVPAAEQ